LKEQRGPKKTVTTGTRLYQYHFISCLLRLALGKLNFPAAIKTTEMNIQKKDRAFSRVYLTQEQLGALAAPILTPFTIAEAYGWEMHDYRCP
jgi:hypothetical protein